MATSGNYTFTVDKGTTIKFEVKYKYCDKSPIDLTGYSAQMKLIKDATKDESCYYDVNECECTNSQIQGIDYPFIISSSILPDGTGISFNGISGLLPSSSGAIAVEISSQTSSMFNFNVAKYQLDIFDNNEVIRILTGNIYINNNIL